MDSNNFDDIFGTESAVTPSYGSLRVKGDEKLLVAVFIVDCSRTMEGERIGAVNAALQELKYKLSEIKDDNNLNLKIAIMSFTSNAKWELSLTPIEEAAIGTMQVRPGLTEYGVAFHELNKVLRKDQFMKHTGRIAPPAIMFLTDGEPNDDYEHDLKELLKNGWFANASRSVVLLGDAITDPAARKAVSRFVKDENADIVSAEEGTVIMQKIRLATMHTIMGESMAENFGDERNENEGGTAGDDGREKGGSDSLFPDPDDGEESRGSLSAGQDDQKDVLTGGENPFDVNSLSGDDPFGGSADPFI